MIFRSGCSVSCKDYNTNPSFRSSALPKQFSIPNPRNEAKAIPHEVGALYDGPPIHCRWWKKGTRGLKGYMSYLALLGNRTTRWYQELKEGLEKEESLEPQTTLSYKCLNLLMMSSHNNSQVMMKNQTMKMHRYWKEYDIWAREMEHYLELQLTMKYERFKLLERKGRLRISADWPLPRTYGGRFHGMDDAKRDWEAI
ncbi:hypothetical protein Tco_1485178 [Tanacetum coccineum]